MQFDLDLVFQIKNIEMWNIFPLDNDPQKYKVSHRDRPTVLSKMNVNTPKPLENIQGKTSF
jgi:hypothetical protein